MEALVRGRGHLSHRSRVPRSHRRPAVRGRKNPHLPRPRRTAGPATAAPSSERRTTPRMGAALSHRRRTERISRHMSTVTDVVDELRVLESEAVHIIREVVAELERPVLLFSAGKDSIVLLRLAEKAFRPSPLPFPVLHVDTGHNFEEVIEFRDR